MTDDTSMEELLAQMLDVPLPMPTRGRGRPSKNTLGSFANNKKDYKTKKATEALAKSRKSYVVDPETIRRASPEMVKEHANRPVIFQANPGPQTEFLEADEDEVLFAGGRGSGKSMALVVDPLRYVTNPNFRGLILRRTTKELSELISRTKDIYFKLPEPPKWRERDLMFSFPSGAVLMFGYCDHIDDVERYRGQQYTWLGIDELSQFPSREYYDKLKGSLRTTDKSLPIRIRATTNPSGAGRGWVKEYFVDVAEAGKSYIKEYDTKIGKIRSSRKWLQSTVYDNPQLLAADPTYLAKLYELPEVMRKQWVEGSWEAMEGLAFPDFNQSKHVIPAFDVPRNWLRFRGCDWGYGQMAATLWIAMSPDQKYYVYREYCKNGKMVDNFGLPIPKQTAGEYSTSVAELEAAERVSYGVLDSSVWANRGDSGPSIAEEMLKAEYFASGKETWRPADRSPGSRVAGKQMLHRVIQEDRLYIFDNCRHLIKCLSSIPLDVNNAEDVDTKADDHTYDALRYALMSRAEFSSSEDDWASRSQYSPHTPINTDFGI